MSLVSLVQFFKITFIYGVRAYATWPVYHVRAQLGSHRDQTQVMSCGGTCLYPRSLLTSLFDFFVMESYVIAQFGLEFTIYPRLNLNYQMIGGQKGTPGLLELDSGCGLFGMGSTSTFNC